MSKFLSGRQSKLYVGISSISDEKTVLQVTGKVGIGTTTGQHHSLYVNGSANISDEILVGGGATVVGIGSFQNDVYIDQQLYVAGVNITGGVSIGEDITTRNLSVSGFSTFTNAADFNNDIDVDGHTELDDLNVSGVSTFAGAIDANGNLDVDGRTELDTTNISETLNVVGISTFGSDVDINASIDVDGHTELDDLNVSGVATFAQNVEIIGNLTVNGTQTILNTSQLEVEDINIGIASADPKLSNAALDGAGITIYGAAGDKTLTWSNPNSRMEFNTDLFAPNIETTNLTLNGGLSVTGVSTFTGNIDANGDLDVDGHTELDNLNVSGVSTFAGAADFNGDVDIDGRTELDITNISETLNVVGISTFGSDVDINASIDVSGHTELDTLNVSVATTTASLTLANAGVAVTAILDEDGLTSDRADALATQQSIKAYVDNLVDAQDLDFAGDTGTGAVDLDTQSLTISGTANEIETSASGQTLTVGLPGEVAITTSLVVGSATTITGSGIIAGIVTGTLDNTLTLNTSGTGLSGSTTYNNSGASTFTVTSNATDANTGGTIVARDGSGNFSAGTITADLIGDVTGVASTATKLETARDFSVSGDVATASGVSFDGTSNVDLAVTLSNTFSANTSGIITSTGGFVGDITGDLTGVASTATKLETARDFSITGDFVTASAVSFDGTGNVSLAATITADSIELGTYTSGDYVESITGTANEVEVTGGSGEGSTPQIGLPSNVTITNDLIVGRDVQINRDLNVTGNITVGGTSGTLFTETLQVADADLVLGVRTDAFGNDVSTDSTANHGGIAIASTEGNPLVNLNIVGIETLASTYKKIMWFKAGSFSGLGTDAWLSNYAVGIGSTQFPTGTRLAAGSVQFTENDLAVVRNINASGIITGTLDNTLTLATSGNGLSGSATYDNSGAATFTVTSDATSANTAETIVYRDASGDFSAGTITANLTGNVTGDLTGTATTATNLADGANITTGTISDDRLPDLITSNINITTGVSTVGTLDVVSVVADSLSVSGVSTFSDDVSIADKIIHTGDTNTAIRFPAADTFTVETAGSERLRVTSAGRVGIGTDAPSEKLDVNGDIRLRGAIYDSLNNAGSVNQILVSNAGAGVTWTDLTEIPVGDAATLDGLDSTQFLRSDAADTKTGITTFSDDVILQSNLNVTGVSTFVGVGTFNNDLYVGNDLDVSGNINFNGSLFQNNQPFIASRWTAASNGLDIYRLSSVGIGTSTINAVLTIGGDTEISGVVTARQFVGGINAGIATLGITTAETLDVHTSTRLRGQIKDNFDNAGTSSYVLTSGGPSGNWSWQPVTAVGAGTLNGFIVQEEGVVVGTAGSITAIDFRGGNVTATADPQPNGIATITFSSTPTFDSVTVTGALDVDGHTELDDLNVSGVSTFTGAADFNNDIDVDGHTELDDLNVSGFSTFTGAADFNGNVDVDGHTELDDLSVSGVSTFTGAIDANGDLDVDGHTELDDVNVSGVSTFAGAADFNGDIDVDGHTELDNVNVSGVSTFVGVGTFQNDLFVGGALDVDGNINLNGLLFQNNSPFIASYWVQTGAGIHTLGSVGVGTTNPVGSFEVSGHTELDNVNVSGVSTFVGIVTNQSTIFGTQLSVSGVSTFNDAVDINGGLTANTATVEDLTDNRVVISGPGGRLEDSGNLTFDGSNLTVGVGLDVDGHTELDNLRVSGVSTFQGNVFLGDNDVLRFGNGGDLQIVHNSSNNNSIINESGPGNLVIGADNNVEIKNTSGTEFKAKFITDGAVELYNNNSKKFETTGYGVTVYGTTDTDGLIVSGVSTFSGNIDLNADLDVDGHTELDDVNVSGVSTFVGIGTFQSDLYVGGALYVSGRTLGDDIETRNISVSGLSTFTGAADFNGNVDIDGHTELDNINVAGVSTFVGTISAVDANFTGNVTIGGTLTYEDVTNIDSVGIITARSDVRVGGNLSSVGITTLASAGGITTTGGDLYVGGNLYATGNLVCNESSAVNLYVSGVTTSVGGFVGNLTGTATTATNLADAANITTGTINSARLTGTYNIDISGNAATATYASTAGIATYASNAGIATYATSAGIATYASNAGIATYASTAGIATYASNAGIATYASTSGISTNVIGGIASVTQLSVSGITTLGFFSDDQTISQDISLADNTRYYSVHKNLTVDDGSTLTVGSGSTILLDRFNNLDDVKAQSLSVTGIITASSFDGDLSGNADTATYASNAGIATYATSAGIATYATTAGIATSTVGGYIDVGNASISGISTLGFFSDDQTISQDISLADNTRYYSVHKNLTVDDGSTLTVGSGSTILLDRFNNLDTPNAKSVTSPFIMSYNRIRENFTVPTNYNAMSVGPILSVDDGITITVESNSFWSIVPAS